MIHVRHIALYLLASLAGCGDDVADPTRVTLAQGTLQGDRVGSSLRFLKIPYAAPPIGALRFKAPAAAPSWQGTRHETAFASACPQEPSAQGGGSSEEDCLYLNVWTPAERPERAPVMVWIHGGGNFAGSAGDRVPDPLAATETPLFYDGQYFAANQGVVLVTLNYRLGPFGFFSHPALAAEGSPRGNQGLFDQRAALVWVRDNIARFGGDPENVTLFGESAGSADVCYHVVSPGSRGLFHRAISQSGGCTASPTGSADPRAEATADAMAAYSKSVGCAGDDPLACLRRLPVSALLAQAQQPNPSGDFFAEPSWRFSVVVDGEDGFLPAPAREQFARGDVAKVPYLLGSNADEGTLFTLTVSVPDEAAYLALLTKGYGAELAARIAEVYPGEKFGGDYRAALARVIGDAGLGCGTHDSARRARAAGLPVFMYTFNVPWKVSFGLLGAAHGAEISHVFGSPYRADATDLRVSDAMNTYWASFAERGDPNFDGAPAVWPAFEPSASDDDERLELDGDFGLLNGFRKAECAFWRSLYDELAAP
jgi:para-nitrobenzyl esterase